MPEEGEPLLRDYEAQNGGHGYEEDSPSTSYSENEGATVIQATFSLVNIYMGLGLLSMPYAMRLSGWFGLLALLASTAVFCTSAKLLIRAFQTLPAGILHSYPNLGTKILGPCGKYVVAGFTVLEFFGGSCIMLVVLWQEFVAVLPNHDIQGSSPFHFAVAVSMLALVPMILIPSFKRLSWLNLVGCLSTVLVTLVLLLSVLMDADRSRMPIQPPAGHDVLRLGVFRAIGIFVLSVSGHSSLPVLRNSMKRPQDFDKVLNLGFSTMFVLYALVAGCGYYYWGWDSHELCTTDLKYNLPIRGVSLLIPGLTVDKLVSAFILCNAFTTYPNLLLVIQDTVWSVTPWAAETGPHPMYLIGTAIRIVPFFMGSIISYGAYNYVGDIMSLSGGFCSISCSLLVPSLFYLLLYRRQLHRGAIVALIGLMSLGLVLLVFITTQNMVDIAEKSRDVSMAREVSSLAGLYLLI